LRWKSWKVKDSERLIDMTRYLLEKPIKLVSLTYFGKSLWFRQKSSISEDLSIIKKTFKKENFFPRVQRQLETSSWAAGGVRYIPARIAKEEAKEFIEAYVWTVCQRRTAYLPGGYVIYQTYLGEPQTVTPNRGKKLLLLNTLHDSIDAVMTVANQKGVPNARAVSSYLNVPFVMVRLILKNYRGINRKYLLCFRISERNRKIGVI